jgi:hypothetical protein
VVDANDWAPVLTKAVYTAELPENVNANVEAVKTKANDMDATVRCLLCVFSTGFGGLLEDAVGSSVCSALHRRSFPDPIA